LGNKKISSEDKRDRGNVWFITYPTIQEKRPHPAVFPVKLPEMCIKLHGIKDGLLVYDPACKRLGVKYIGTEMSGGYIEIANEQLSPAIVHASSPTCLEEFFVS